MSENGDHKPKDDGRTPLERVKEKISARIAEEQGSGILSIGEAGGEDDVVPASDGEDPLYAWKRREDGKEPTLDQLHSGLIAVSQISEAAIEGGINMAADLNKALSTIAVTASQAATIASKTEANAAAIDKVDEDCARMDMGLKTVRKDVQSIKEDLAEVKLGIRQLPAIKEMLGEILTRLPDPKPKKRKRKSV